MTEPGASAVPLARKLNLRDGMRVWFHAMPDDVHEELDEYALELTFVADPARGIDAAHVFVTKHDELAELLIALRNQIALDGQVWVSWPISGSDITEDRVRELALPEGYIDTKSSPVNELWNGLKLVIRKDLR